MATKRTSNRKDFTQTALDVVRLASGEVTAPAPSKKPESGHKGGEPKPTVRRRQGR
jgi:hypothetical protein